MARKHRSRKNKNRQKTSPKAVAAPPPASNRAVWLAAASLILAAIVVYANSFSGPFIFDDLLSIPKNPTIRGFLSSLIPPGGGVTVTGRPVLNLSFALNYALSGDHVWSYHLLNLLIHLGAALTLFGIVRRTLKRLGGAVGDQATMLGFFVALLWLVHPLQTEAVTYMVQRAESLMGLLYLLTLYGFIRGVEAGESGLIKEKRRQRWWFGLAFVACLLGIGTKEVIVSAPVIVFLYDRTFLAGDFRGAWNRRKWIHLGLFATWIPLALLVLNAAGRGGTAGFGAGVGFWQYAVTQFQAICHYLWLSIWPHPLIIDYGAEWVKSAWGIIPYAIVVLTLVAATLVALVRWPVFGFLGFFFFSILAPTSLVPVVRQTLAEHRMYLALAPVLVLVVLGLHSWLGRRVWLAVATISVVFGSLTIARNIDYRSDVSIWSDTVAKRPGNVYARNNYGNILAQGRNPEESLDQYAAAIKDDPNFADAYFNAGNALKRLGRYPEAIARYHEALKIDPGMATAEIAMGNAFKDSGRIDEAMVHYKRAWKIDPKNINAQNDLGLALMHQGHTEEAILSYKKALTADPNSTLVLNNLGNALGVAGRIQEAIAQFKKALKLQPDFVPAYNNLGNLYRSENRQPEAIAEYRQALKFAPDSPRLHDNLGVSLMISGRSQEGIDEFRRALRLNPSMGQAHLHLALALESVGQKAEAEREFEMARRLGAHMRQ